MAKRLNPYVIKRADGAFYTRSNVVGKRPVMDEATNTARIVPVCRPVFGATNELEGTQFHTREDAERHMADPDLGQPADWADCAIVNVFD